MQVEVKVPQLAESVADATLLDWHKNAGDAVKRGDNLIDLETDKVTLEVAAPEDGVITKILKNTGDTVVSQETLAIIDTSKVKLDVVAGTDSGKQAKAAEPEQEAGAPQRPAPSEESAPAKHKRGPAADKLMREQGVDEDDVEATGRRGHVTKGDVLRAADKPAGSEQPAAEPAPPAGDRPEERVPMSRLRRRTAERLLAAQHENALLTTFNDVNLERVMALRSQYKDAFEKRHGVRLGFMSFFVKAAVEALKQFPVVNASVDGDAVAYHGYYDIGIAVSSERGLVVPILRDADQMSFADIERQITDYGQRARTGKLTLEELTGGTFSITNGGVFGSLLSTPIINPPQSAILGMHKIEERAIVVNGQISVAPMMYLALSYDHRIIDGREAVQFLVSIKEQLADPARIMMQI